MFLLYFVKEQKIWGNNRQNGSRLPVYCSLTSARTADILAQSFRESLWSLQPHDGKTRCHHYIAVEEIRLLFPVRIRKVQANTETVLQTKQWPLPSIWCPVRLSVTILPELLEASVNQTSTNRVRPSAATQQSTTKLIKHSSLPNWYLPIQHCLDYSSFSV